MSAQVKNYDVNNIGNAYFNTWFDKRSTVEKLIKERKAYIFLEKYCGIQLYNKYWIDENNNVTYWENKTTDNVDTGATPMPTLLSKSAPLSKARL